MRCTRSSREMSRICRRGRHVRTRQGGLPYKSGVLISGRVTAQFRCDLAEDPLKTRCQLLVLGPWALLSRCLATQRRRLRSCIDSCGTRGSSLILSAQAMTQHSGDGPKTWRRLWQQTAEARAVLNSVRCGGQGHGFVLEACGRSVAAWSSHRGDRKAEQRAATSIGEIARYFDCAG